MANTVRCFHSRSLGLDILARRRHHGNCSAFRSLELGPNHRPLQAALSGSLIKAPGFAGGYLHYLMDYLRRFHTATWAHLRRPSFPTIAEHTANPSRFVQTGLLTLRFIFSTGYKSL